MHIPTISLLAVAAAHATPLPYPVVDTGQVLSYDNHRSIDPPESGDAFFGQDSNYRGTQPSYRDNGDGTTEIEDNPAPKQEMAARTRPERGQERRPERGPGQGPPDDRPGPPQGGANPHFQNLDRNKDGKVSSSEFDGPRRHFREFDRNKDGYLSEDEFPKGPPERRPR